MVFLTCCRRVSSRASNVLVEIMIQTKRHTEFAILPCIFNQWLIGHGWFSISWETHMLSGFSFGFWTRLRWLINNWKTLFDSRWMIVTPRWHYPNTFRVCRLPKNRWVATMSHVFFAVRSHVANLITDDGHPQGNCSLTLHSATMSLIDPKPANQRVRGVRCVNCK